jgi:hypothetical protein
VPAGYGKVAVLDRLRETLNIGRERVVYVGDGISDVHVMLHVSRMDGLTIAVSENKYLTQIARRTILSDNAISVLVPILEDIVGGTVRAFTRSSKPRIRAAGMGEGAHRPAHHQQRPPPAAAMSAGA